MCNNKFHEDKISKYKISNVKNCDKTNKTSFCACARACT